MQPESGTRTVELRGPLGSAQMPAMCVNCATGHSGFATVESLFVRSYDDAPNVHVVSRVPVPLCVDCLHRHYQERPPLDPAKRILLIFRTPEVFAGIAPGVVALFMLYIATPGFLKFEPIAMVIFGGLAAFFALISFFGFRSAWLTSERFAVQPPSSVTEAISFTDDRSELFEPERHLWRLRNPKFAAAFIELNRTRIWRPDGRYARVAQRKRKVAYIAFGIVAACILVYSVLEDLGLLP